MRYPSGRPSTRQRQPLLLLCSPKANSVNRMNYSFFSPAAIFLKNITYISISYLLYHENYIVMCLTFLKFISYKIFSLFLILPSFFLFLFFFLRSLLHSFIYHFRSSHDRNLDTIRYIKFLIKILIGFLIKR